MENTYENNDLLLDFKERSYPITFRGDFNQLPAILKERKVASKVLIVSDSNVDREYGNVLYQILVQNGFKAAKYVFQAGEPQKNLHTISNIYDECLKNQLDRNSAIIALGGGVTGDMAGFAAATYMRGIRFVQVPTSLLAQVDSSVGGKVGVDYQGTKNIVGAFHQPVLVYMNISTLRTLPRRELIAGMAEVIKHGIIYDSEFFRYLEHHMEQILNLDMDTLKYVIRRNCEIKAEVVQQDETEQGLRAILNFGHTIGHAVESILNFSMLHGECVSIGMAAASFIACSKDLLTCDDYERIIALLKNTGLPIQVNEMDVKAVYNEMLKDKKQVDSRLKFILPVKIGAVIQTLDVSKEEIFRALEIIK